MILHAFNLTKAFISLMAFLLVTNTFAQSTPITVQPTGYTILVNSKSTDMEMYTIHNSPYCKIEDLAVVMSGVFDVKTTIGKNFYDLDFPVFEVSTKKTQKGSTPKGNRQPKKAQSTYAHLYVDGIQRPTTPYKIDNNHYFKLADILRILDIELTVNDTKRTITINTNAPFKLNAPKAPVENNAPKKWTKIPANIGMAVRCMNGYFDVNSSSIIYNDMGSNASALTGIAIVHIPTGNRLELPFDEKENSYGEVYRGFSQGWIQVISTTKKGRNFTYVNTNGEVINPKMFFTTARAFENGYAFVTYQENGADYSGVIDLNGELVVAVAGKYENAFFANEVFGFRNHLKQNHNNFYDDHYYHINGKRLNITKERAEELQSPGYKLAEVEQFEKHRSKYSKSLYCGYNRFLAETNGKTQVVDSDNKTVFQTQIPMHIIRPVFAWGKLFFSNGGILDHNGKQILESKYTWIEPVDGKAFLTIIDNRAQTLVGIDGKVLASSPNAPLWALKKGELITLRNYNLKSEIVSGDVVMLYSNMDLDKSLPTDRLKQLIATYPYADSYLMPTHNEVRTIVQKSTANALYVIALENLYNTRFSKTKVN